MATKKYVVREGFVVQLAVQQSDGSVRTREFGGGDEVTLEDEDAALHRHKLEFAQQRDRDAALAAEQEAAAKTASVQNPALLIQQLVSALAMAQEAVPQAPAPAPATA